MVELLAGEPFSFESQAKQFSIRGTPGIAYERHSVGSFPDHDLIECLLHYSPASIRFGGILTGILYFYPQDVYERRGPRTGEQLEKAGAVNIFVHPRFRMRGIGRALVAEAMQRWTIDPEKQRYSQDGLHFRLALEGRSEWR